MTLVSSSHVPPRTSSFVVVLSISRTLQVLLHVIFGVLRYPTFFFDNTFCTASWKALPLVVEHLKNRTFSFVVFLTLWIVIKPTSSGLTFCFRFFTIYAYVIPGSGGKPRFLKFPCFPVLFSFFIFVFFFLLLLTSWNTSISASD